MSYEYLKDKFGKILILDISDNKPEIRIDITAFKIKEMKGKHVEFVQYVAFIYLKLREFNSNNNTLCTMKIELKDTGIKNFSPTFLRTSNGFLLSTLPNANICLIITLA